MLDRKAYDYAIELGFTEEEARSLQACKVGKGASQENILRIARVKRLPSTKPDYPMPSPEPLTPMPSSTSETSTPHPVITITSSKPKRRKIAHRRRRVKEG